MKLWLKKCNILWLLEVSGQYLEKLIVAGGLNQDVNQGFSNCMEVFDLKTGYTLVYNLNSISGPLRKSAIPR